MSPPRGLHSPGACREPCGVSPPFGKVLFDSRTVPEGKAEGFGSLKVDLQLRTVDQTI